MASVITKEEVLDDMVPMRMRRKTIVKLKEFKSVDNKTRLVHSTNFGFERKLSMYVSNDLSNTEIIRRFELRLSEKSINMYQKKKV